MPVLQARYGLHIAVVVMAAAACTQQDERGFQDLGQVRYEDPVPVSHGSLRHVMSIGEAEGPLAFSDVPDAAAGPQGVLAVVDRGNCQIALVDSAGTLLRRLGRCGKGPGELTTPMLVDFRADSLIIYDKAQGALLLWNLEGRETRRLALAPLPGAAGIRNFAVLDDSTLAVAKELECHGVHG